MAQKALKLQVPRPVGGPITLCVKDGCGRSIVIDDQWFPPGPHVEQRKTYVLVKDFFGDDNKVPDVSRYCIGGEGYCGHHDDKYRIWHDRYLVPHCNITEEGISSSDIPEPCLQARLKEQRKMRAEQERPEIGNIVLLLESPHKYEYNANPKRPALGTTGTNIDILLWIVLRYIQIKTGLIEPGCDVVISNPIQFQTSLSAISEPKSYKNNWRTVRNNVFRTLLEQEHIKQCFRARLGCYYPKVIINACTGKLEESDSLKSLVDRFVQQELETNTGLPENVSLYTIAHPSSWRSLRPTCINP